MKRNLLSLVAFFAALLLNVTSATAQSPQAESTDRRVIMPTGCTAVFVSSTTPVQVLPPAPVLYSPVDMATGISASGCTLVWNSVPNCMLYECQYSTDSTFTTGVMGGSTGATVWFTPAIFPLTTYYWRVRASDGASFSGWSDVWQFNTDNVIGITEQVQAEVQLFPMPCNQQLVVQSSAAMSWLTLTDLSGRTVLSADVSNEMRLELNTGQLPAGIYILRTDTFVKRIEVVR
jgi:hypothetical protein